MASHEPAMRALLRDCLRIASVSGQEKPFALLLCAWARQHGFVTDLWETDESDLSAYPQSRLRHLPLAGRPSLVITLPGGNSQRRLLFNGHLDVVPAPQVARWTHPPFDGVDENGRFFGRGACDVKGPIISALWAMLVLKQLGPLDADVAIELIPGEEDCVGLGTLTSVVRGHKADGLIVLEPTESMPRPASRAAVRFDIAIAGRSVHGTVKWLGDDAIVSTRRVLDRLEEMERLFHAESPDPLFRAYPIARPITVDTVRAGHGQGMLADEATIGGYFELLPDDDISQWKLRFARSLHETVDSAKVTIAFSEEYAGHRTPADHPFCQLAQTVTEPLTCFEWSGFNSGCEAGLRAQLFGTPTLVWGPGSLAQAHAVDEYVDFADVRRCAGQFANFARAWAKA